METAAGKIVLVGAGGHGSEVRAYILDLLCRGWHGRLLGFLDDNLPKGPHRGLEIIGTLAEFAAQPPECLHGTRYLTAVGDNPTRRSLVERIEQLLGDRVPAWSLIHPSAFVGNSEIGEGTLLAPGSIVTSRSRVGSHVIVNVKASVSHDCEIGDFVNINPNATVCGWCRVGAGVYIGAGATIIDRMQVGEGAIIGAGAVVTRDIPPHVTAVGVPARVIKTH